jgi:shikimate dehydrogenase
LLNFKHNRALREYGLIGYPLDHAFSKKFFAEKFEKENIQDVKYNLYPLAEVAKLKNILDAHPNLCGLNVTTPYKELVIPFLDDIDPLALSIGAVNTISIEHHEDNELFLRGFNTDIFGVERLLSFFDLPERALVFGSGGSSRAVRYALQKKGVSGLTVTRQVRLDDYITYEQINKHILAQHKLIINCTPVGMYPKTNQFPPIPYEFLTSEHICIDLIYNPERTLFLQKAENHGAKIMNGYAMLIEQAERAWDIWENIHVNMKVS